MTNNIDDKIYTYLNETKALKYTIMYPAGYRFYIIFLHHKYYQYIFPLMFSFKHDFYVVYFEHNQYS